MEWPKRKNSTPPSSKGKGASHSRGTPEDDGEDEYSEDEEIGALNYFRKAKEQDASLAQSTAGAALVDQDSDEEEVQNRELSFVRGNSGPWSRLPPECLFLSHVAKGGWGGGMYVWCSQFPSSSEPSEIWQSGSENLRRKT